LRRSILDVIARILAGQTHGLYGYLEFVRAQAFVDTAEAEYLQRFGSIYAVQQIPAEFAAGNIVVTGTSGIAVPIETTLRRSNGVAYQTTAGATLAAGTATIPVTAIEAGAEGNAAAAVELTFVSPIGEVDAIAVVDSGGLTGGTDVESDEAYRARIIAKIRRPPGGGTASDYERKTKEYPGVTDVHVHTAQFGAGTVGVAPLFYDRADPIPTAGDLTSIQLLLDDSSFKPLCATPTAYALTPTAVNFSASVTPDTDEVKAAVEAEVAALFRRDAVPGGVLLISRIREAFSQAAGETDYVLTSPSAKIDLAGDLSQISVVGTFTWS